MSAWRNVLRQAGREFSLAIFCSIVWAFWSYYQSGEGLFGAIEKGFAALFLVSWFSGQFIRINKTQKTERNFDQVLSNLTDVATGIQESSEQIIAYVTGGDSFVFIEFEDPDSSKALVHKRGTHPMYDVHVQVYDPDLLPNQAKILDFRIPAITSIPVVSGAYWDGFKIKTVQHLQVAIVSRSGLIYQELILVKDAGKWYQATMVKKAATTTVYVKVPENFPLSPKSRIIDEWKAEQKIMAQQTK